MIPASDCQKVLDFIKDKYLDQLAPILTGTSQEYCVINFDLLGFIFDFASIGQLFYSYSEDFNHFLCLCMQACQVQLSQNTSSDIATQIKSHLEIRLTNIPPSDEVMCGSIRKLQ